MAEREMRANLLLVGTAYANGRGIRLTTASQRLHGDPPFFDNLAKGTISFTARKYDEVMQRASNEWPAGVSWPKLKRITISRPTRTGAKDGKAEEGRKAKTSKAKKGRGPEAQ